MATAILTILNGQTKSNSLSDVWGADAAKIGLAFAKSISVKSPGTLTGTVTVQVAQVSPAADGDFVAAQNLTTDVTIAAAKSVTFPMPSCQDLRIISGSAEGADRQFYVTLQEEMD